MRFEMNGVFQGVNQFYEGNPLFAVLLLNEGQVDLDTVRKMLEKKVRITVEEIR